MTPREALIPLAEAVADAEAGPRPRSGFARSWWRREWDAVFLREMERLARAARGRR